MKYSGSCHCGNVKFEVEMDISEVISCNCSICSKKGILMAFAPEPNFKLLKSDALKDYQFGKKNIHHEFCGNCGIHAFGHGKNPKGEAMRAINVRCLDDVDPASFPVKFFDGKSL